MALIVTYEQSIKKYTLTIYLLYLILFIQIFFVVSAFELPFTNNNHLGSGSITPWVVDWKKTGLDLISLISIQWSCWLFDCQVGNNTHSRDYATWKFKFEEVWFEQFHLNNYENVMEVQT